MKARIKKLASDEGMSTVVEIDGVLFEAMDCLGYGGFFKEGEIVDIQFSVGLDDEGESWEEIFQGNPNKQKRLENLGGWSYRALGEVVSINPVVVDCGIQSFEGVIDTNDTRCVGEFVGFNINRLDVWVASNASETS